MNILVLDLSTHSTGYCITNEWGKIIDYGCIISNASKNLKRIQVMAEKICELVQQHKIEKIVAEEVIPDYSDKTYKTLTWLQGIVFYSVFLINPKVEQEMIGASSWRSRIGIKTGRGVKRQELKKADMDYVFNKYGITANDDVCDAICLKDAYFKEKNAKKVPQDDVAFFEWN